VAVAEVTTQVERTQEGMEESQHSERPSLSPTAGLEQLSVLLLLVERHLSVPPSVQRFQVERVALEHLLELEL
jgi:hypothetical protein